MAFLIFFWRIPKVLITAKNAWRRAKSSSFFLKDFLLRATHVAKNNVTESSANEDQEQMIHEH